MLKEEEEKKRRLGGRTKTVRQSHEMNNQADNDDAHRSKKKDGLGSIIESWSNVEVSPKSPGYLHVRRQAVGGAGGCAEALEAFACSVLWRPVYLSIRGNRALRLRSILFLGSCAAASPAVLCPFAKRVVESLRATASGHHKTKRITRALHRLWSDARDLAEVFFSFFIAF